MPAKQHSHSHPNSPLFVFLRRQLRYRCISQKLQTKFVEIFVVFLASVVSGEYFCKHRIDFRVQISERLSFSPDLVYDLQTVMVLTKVELFLSDCDSEQELSVSFTFKKGTV